jgi:hypothetical protein
MKRKIFYPTQKVEIKELKVPEIAANLAIRRTAPIIHFWARRADYSLQQLAASCYLQGINDCLETVESKAPEAAEAFYKVLELIEQ